MADKGGGQAESMKLLQGTLDVLILSMLEAGPDHGYGVTRRIHERTEGVLQVDDAALYQSLHRMRARGWIAGEWGVSDRGRRARFYRITPKGLDRLRAETASWARYSTAVGRVLGTS